MKRETRVQLIAGILGAVFLGASGLVATELTASTGRNKLGYATRAVDGDPPQVALGIAMGAFRGMFVNWLWMRADSLKEQGKYHEAINLANAITTLQPRFPKVWQFQAWNMAYNISVKTQTPEERWEWVNKGIRLLREEGVVHNPNSLDLHRELAWILLHKVAGNTDDSNQYYKRRFAYEWTYLLGDPPGPDPDARSREAVTEQFALWLESITEAPATIEGLVAADPKAAELIEKLATLAGEYPDTHLLEHYQMHRAVERSGLRALIEEDMGGRSLELRNLMHDPQYADTWPTLINTIRRRVLADEYNMNIFRMIRYTRKFGPLDWRHPAAHAVYWGQRGVENASTQVNADNDADYDFVNADRIVVQAVQELYRSGEIFFDSLGFRLLGNQEQTLYLAMPNVHFLETYGEIIEEAIPRAGVFESNQRYFTMFSAGYENFLNDGIRFLWRRGQIADARKWYEKIRNWERQNLNTPDRAQKYGAPLEEFIQKQFYEERYKTPYVASSEVYGGLQAAYVALLSNDGDRFRAQFDYAQRFHRIYIQEQYREVLAAGDSARQMPFPRDFQLLAGAQFGFFMQMLDLDSAASAYMNAPDSLRKSAYDILVARFQEVLDDQADEGGLSFNETFPKPPGMDAFRMAWQQKLDARQKNIEVEAK